MHYQIRRGTFETNSSSVHSLTLCSESDYERWSNGELFYEELERDAYERIEEFLKGE